MLKWQIIQGNIALCKSVCVYTYVCAFVFLCVVRLCVKSGRYVRGEFLALTRGLKL